MLTTDDSICPLQVEQDSVVLECDKLSYCNSGATAGQVLGETKCINQGYGGGATVHDRAVSEPKLILHIRLWRAMPNTVQLNCSQGS